MDRILTTEPTVRCRGRAGFTLLEVLVAFVIASIALAVLYHGAIDGLLGSRQAMRTDEAVARARSRLAVLCQQTRQTPGEQSGDDGSGYTWRTQITLAGSEMIERGDPEQPLPPMRVDLYAVRVILSWPGPARAHQVSLETRCLAAAAADSR